MLLLHGIPQTHRRWRRVAPLLTSHHTVVATDLRGYGASHAPPSAPDHAPYAMRALADEQVAVMAEFGFADPLWREWADGVRGHALDCGHFLAGGGAGRDRGRTARLPARLALRDVLALQLVAGVIVVCAFAGVQLRLLDAHGLPYLLANVSTTGVLAAIAAHEQQWGFVLTNGFWAGISAIGLVQLFRGRRVVRPEEPVV